MCSHGSCPSLRPHHTMPALLFETYLRGLPTVWSKGRFQLEGDVRSISWLWLAYGLAVFQSWFPVEAKQVLVDAFEAHQADNNRVLRWMFFRDLTWGWLTAGGDFYLRPQSALWRHAWYNALTWMFSGLPVGCQLLRFCLVLCICSRSLPRTQGSRVLGGIWGDPLEK